MGIDYYSCEICGTAFPDVINYGHCGKCESTLCGDCFDEMREKNGELGENHEKASWYGEEAPNCCDLCDGSKLDLDSFIEFLVDKLNKSRQELEEEFTTLQEDRK